LSQLLMLVPVLALTVSAPAQDKFEAGGLAVASFYQDLNVRSGPVTGAMGFQPGASGGLLVGQTLTDRLGGEVRYVFSHNDLRLKSGSTETLFSAHTHIVHYDLLFYAARRSAAVRPYLAGGGGMKVYQATGTEQAFQPLANLALLTRTNQTVGMLDFGGGVKFRIKDNAWFRIEIRDYITEVPKVFVASPGASVNGLFHQWTPAFGVTWTF
jgi:hypothetical protein